MTDNKSGLRRDQLLAAEVFGYSYANYHDHLGIGNVRYEQLMPESISILERATRESWPLSRLSRALQTDAADAQEFLEAYHRAINVVDAANPAEGFRTAVRFVVQDAVDSMLSEDEVEELVTQICYRAADLGYILAQRGESLSRYSRHLRREAGVEYYDGYFDESDA